MYIYINIIALVMVLGFPHYLFLDKPILYQEAHIVGYAFHHIHIGWFASVPGP